MNPIPLLTTAVDSLWMWTYGLVAGWGVTFTLLIAAVVFLAVRILKLSRRISNLENRLVHAERDYNITLTKWQK
jgi:uncharacterized membrane protein YhiD involved in acid resistance